MKTKSKVINRSLSLVDQSSRECLIPVRSFETVGTYLDRRFAMIPRASRGCLEWILFEKILKRNPSKLEIHSDTVEQKILRVQSACSTTNREPSFILFSPSWKCSWRARLCLGGKSRGSESENYNKCQVGSNDDDGNNKQFSAFSSYKRKRFSFQSSEWKSSVQIFKRESLGRIFRER